MKLFRLSGQNRTLRTKSEFHSINAKLADIHRRHTNELRHKQIVRLVIDDIRWCFLLDDSFIH
ncbi:hypothetical protein D3C80_1588250 [compost metagenome]